MKKTLAVTLLAVLAANASADAPRGFYRITNEARKQYSEDEVPSCHRNLLPGQGRVIVFKLRDDGRVWWIGRNVFLRDPHGSPGVTCAIYDSWEGTVDGHRFVETYTICMAHEFSQSMIQLDFSRFRDSVIQCKDEIMDRGYWVFNPDDPGIVQ